MTLVEIIPYDYVPYSENIYEKRTFKLNFDMDFPMLLEIALNLEHPDMVHLKKSISNFLYRNSTQFWTSILEEKSSEEGEYEQSQFLDNAFLSAYSKNDLLIKNI
tara:strand:- start:3381 stop:3695 length:315 start_codon:yes stop_codon:yes gene_type:complete